MGRRIFSREFKLEAVKLVRERGVAVAQARRDLDIAKIQRRPIPIRRPSVSIRSCH
jgi:transposase-like protein